MTDSTPSAPGTPGDTLTRRKAALRRDALAAREAAYGKAGGTSGGTAGDGATARATARLSDLLARTEGRIVAGYMPIRSELDPRPAMEAEAARRPVCVPVIEARGAPLIFRQWTPDATLIPGTFGALIPERSATLVPDVVIVPLVAFDRQGGRLGYGGGFYDRTLAGLRDRGAALAIGFAYAAQEVGDLPIEPTDIPLDWVVTEDEVIGPLT
ncbi:5-formyltetrahydrofolate cyclo-ligase [Mesobaculum littorinae]|uniref:5-formyltetrahydrofolate cyclo-ligase n=1 Tax=Mesobaculum littorinae TaxID=2486419 RepID=A0A438AL91_9RHOB|nr:5-formyltetrahydrofolate cyclo-ligase [Mesobaculum littorinae]RVV99347.1 5-formyltetrahydrofolate cyclo-ligase [Mesobaculum littorinae]